MYTTLSRSDPKGICHFLCFVVQQFALRASSSHSQHIAIHADSMATCKAAAKECCIPKHKSFALKLQKYVS